MPAGTLTSRREAPKAEIVAPAVAAVAPSEVA